MKNFFPVLMVLAMAGCAAPGPESGDTQAAVVCSKETATGTNLIVTKCRTVAQAEKEREDARAAGEEINRARTGIRAPAGQ